MSNSTSEQYDPAFLGILSNENNIKGFLNNVFSFLMRRTDFYRHQTPENPKLGFPPGVAKKMVLESFTHYEQLMAENIERIRVAEAAKSQNESKPTPRPVQEIPLGAPQASSRDDNGPVYLADAECYNGANREKYSWSQNIKELDINVKIPKEITRSNQLSVKIDKEHLTIKKISDGSVILEDDFSWPVKHTESNWSFDKDTNKLTISLEKHYERWWEAAFVTEEKIDTRNIDCSRPITDLDEEAQAKIAQMKYDQQQKQLGLPTSEEQKIHDILKDAWNLPSSPFRGQDYDMSRMNISTSSTSG